MYCYIKEFEVLSVIVIYAYNNIKKSKYCAILFVGWIIVQYYTSTSNCPTRKLSLWHMSMKLIAISRLRSSISEPAFF